MDDAVLKTKTALVVGCGGLGGFVIEELSRLGIGKLMLVDGDSFCESNMNRQLLATYDTLGKMKAQVYAKWLKSTSKSQVYFMNEFLTKENAFIIDSADIVIDCVDKVYTRKFLASECKARSKVMVHGAVEGEEGQAMVIFPEDDCFDKLFLEASEVAHKTVSYTVATVASVQTSLAVKVLKGSAESFRNKMFVVDMENISIKTLEI